MLYKVQIADEMNHRWLNQHVGFDKPEAMADYHRRNDLFGGFQRLRVVEESIEVKSVIAHNRNTLQ